LFDCLAEGIATLFVFGHVSGRLAMIKSSGFARMLSSIHGFWLAKDLMVTVGTTSPMHLLINSLTESTYKSMLTGTYPSPRDRSNLEAWNQIGWTSVE
jgi:hypothetical protein